MPGNFFDSNTLLYLASPQPEKAAAIRTVVDGGGIINVQVMNEMTNVMRRKFRSPWPQVDRLLSMISHLLVVNPMTIDINTAGRQLAERYGFSVYDSFIVAAALQADCDTLWSEDMQDGLLVEGRMRIANPFAA